MSIKNPSMIKSPLILAISNRCTPIGINSHCPSHFRPGGGVNFYYVVWVELVHTLVGFGPMEGQCIYRMPQQHMLANLEGYFKSTIDYSCLDL
jgi:hypothetical protein